jgi:hypothetical protein
MTKEIIDLIQKNIDLPIYAYVDTEVVADSDACCKWLGKIYGARVADIAIVEPYGPRDETIVELDDYEDYYEYLMNRPEYESLSDTEADVKAITEIHTLPLKKVILIYVDTIGED